MDIQQILNSASGTPFEVTLTQEQIGQLAQSTIGQVALPVPLEDVGVALETGQVRVTAGTKFMGMPMRIEIVGVPVAENSQLRLNINQMLLNGNGAPPFVQSQINDTVNEQLKGEGFPLDVDYIDVQEGSATIRGRKR